MMLRLPALLRAPLPELIRKSGGVMLGAFLKHCIPAGFCRCFLGLLGGAFRGARSQSGRAPRLMYLYDTYMVETKRSNHPRFNTLQDMSFHILAAGGYILG
jgi:hypothetical protein